MSDQLDLLSGAHLRDEGTERVLAVDEHTLTDLRFWSKVKVTRSNVSASETGCWTWTASTGRKGYGVFKVTAGLDRPQGFERPLAMIVLACEDDDGSPRCVFYRPGVFVAADCMPRVDA